MDVRGPGSTAAGPKGQPIEDEQEIAMSVPCRTSAADPAEATKALDGQQTTFEIIKVVCPLDTPVKKQHVLTITDDKRTYTANVISVKPRTANSTAEILYAQEL